MIYTINILLILVISLSNLSIINVLEDPCSNKYEKTELQSDFKYFRKKNLKQVIQTYTCIHQKKILMLYLTLSTIV